jgi:hypothetical protein
MKQLESFDIAKSQTAHFRVGIEDDADGVWSEFVPGLNESLGH